METIVTQQPLPAEAKLLPLRHSKPVWTKGIPGKKKLMYGRYF